jgi:hypothetical protein
VSALIETRIESINEMSLHCMGRPKPSRGISIGDNKESEGRVDEMKRWQNGENDCCGMRFGDCRKRVVNERRG